ncbi:MAG: phage terminase large subunit [Parcubacteria group bacterium]|nr:phage terminase large subunit [Parcubacteria group bacterium]
MSYPIWAILGKQQKKFVLILSQTQSQVKMHLANLKRELESNRLLRQDLGPFEEQDEEWSSGTIVLPKYGARITALSMEQGVRGLRHGSHRPDIIICDDIDDISSVKTKDSRDKVCNWFLGDVVPAGDTDTRIIVVGNLLHEDSLMMRLKNQIESDQLDGSFFSFPIVDEIDKPIWPGKFRKPEDLLNLKRKIGNEVVWQREYMLRIISNTDRVVHPEWIQFYDELPKLAGNVELRGIYSGVDLAISEKTSADYTAIVTVAVYVVDKEVKIYVFPNPVNQRLTFPKTVERIKMLYDNIHESNSRNKIYIEDVGYQKALIQQLEMERLPVEGVGVGGTDKRSRIALTSPHIESGKVLFPKKGCKDLIMQLVDFGAEKNDDLADAFSMVINKAVTIKYCTFGIWDLNQDVGPMIVGDIMNRRF